MNDMPVKVVKDFLNNEAVFIAPCLIRENIEVMVDASDSKKLRKFIDDWCLMGFEAHILRCLYYCGDDVPLTFILDSEGGKAAARLCRLGILVEEKQDGIFVSYVKSKAVLEDKRLKAAKYAGVTLQYEVYPHIAACGNNV